MHEAINIEYRLEDDEFLGEHWCTAVPAVGEAIHIRGRYTTVYVVVERVWTLDGNDQMLCRVKVKPK